MKTTTRAISVTLSLSLPRSLGLLLLPYLFLPSLMLLLCHYVTTPPPLLILRLPLDTLFVVVRIDHLVPGARHSVETFSWKTCSEPGGSAS